MPVGGKAGGAFIDQPPWLHRPGMHMRFTYPVTIKGKHLILQLWEIDLLTHQAANSNWNSFVIVKNSATGDGIRCWKHGEDNLQPQGKFLFPEGKHQRFRFTAFIVGSRQPHSGQRPCTEGTILIDEISGKGAVRQFQFNGRNAKIAFANPRPEKRNIIEAVGGVFFGIHHLAAIGHSTAGCQGRCVFYGYRHAVMQQFHMTVLCNLKQHSSMSGGKQKGIFLLSDMSHSLHLPQNECFIRRKAGGTFLPTVVGKDNGA